jgi:hypothetical protein
MSKGGQIGVVRCTPALAGLDAGFSRSMSVRGAGGARASAAEQERSWQGARGCPQEESRGDELGGWWCWRRQVGASGWCRARVELGQAVAVVGAERGRAWRRAERGIEQCRGPREARARLHGWGGGRGVQPEGSAEQLAGRKRSG